MNFVLIAKFLPYVIQAVGAVEGFAKDLGISGGDKKAAALKFLAGILPAVEGASGGRINLDDAKVAAAVGDVIDAVVSVMNLVHPKAA